MPVKVGPSPSCSSRRRRCRSSSWVATIRSREACSSLGSDRCVHSRGDWGGQHAERPGDRRQLSPAFARGAARLTDCRPAGRHRSAATECSARRRFTVGWPGSCRRARPRRTAAAAPRVSRDDTKQAGIRRCELLPEPRHDSCRVAAVAVHGPLDESLQPRQYGGSQQHQQDASLAADRPTCAEMNRSSTATSAPYATTTANDSNSHASNREIDEANVQQLMADDRHSHRNRDQRNGEQHLDGRARDERPRHRRDDGHQQRKQQPQQLAALASRFPGDSARRGRPGPSTSDARPRSSVKVHSGCRRS